MVKKKIKYNTFTFYLPLLVIAVPRLFQNYCNQLKRKKVKVAFEIIFVRHILLKFFFDKNF